jgi:hypothetical protein
VTGVAWETGLLKGLRDSGLDLTGADLIVGTSAGSIVGTQIAAGLDLDVLYARQLEPPDPVLSTRRRSTWPKRWLSLLALHLAGVLSRLRPFPSPSVSALSPTGSRSASGRSSGDCSSPPSMSRMVGS